MPQTGGQDGRKPMPKGHTPKAGHVLLDKTKARADSCCDRLQARQAAWETWKAKGLQTGEQCTIAV